MQVFDRFDSFQHFTANHNNSMLLLRGILIQDLHISSMNNLAGEVTIIAYFIAPNLSLTNIKDACLRQRYLACGHCFSGFEHTDN